MRCHCCIQTNFIIPIFINLLSYHLCNLPLSIDVSTQLPQTRTCRCPILMVAAS